MSFTFIFTFGHVQGEDELFLELGMLGRFQEDASGEYRWFTKSKTMLSWSRKGWRIQMESGKTYVEAGGN